MVGLKKTINKGDKRMINQDEIIEKLRLFLDKKGLDIQDQYFIVKIMGEELYEEIVSGEEYEDEDTEEEQDTEENEDAEQFDEAIEADTEPKRKGEDVEDGTDK